MTDPSDLFLEAASTMAVIRSSRTPLLFLDSDLTVIAASHSLYRTFGLADQQVIGRRLGMVADGEWNSPQLSVLLKATAAGLAQVDGYEFDLHRSDGGGQRRVLVGAHRLEYEGSQHQRILLAVSDVTEARATEKANIELLREKATLLLEVQHRVANSLQIIASILMQSARRMQSEEARNHINDAHHRLMSLAAVQRQLVESSLDQIALRPYLTYLCESLAASMIYDAKHTALVVEVDDSVVPAKLSVCLGLLVTELVINALKHAFPDHRNGSIHVAYAQTGLGWRLTVSDNGVGMPKTDTASKAGLGTSIVEALTRQLDATVSVSSEVPAH